MSKSRIAIMLTMLTIVVGIIILGVFLFNKPNSDSKLNKLKNFEKTCTEGKEKKNWYLKIIMIIKRLKPRSILMDTIIM